MPLASMPESDRKTLCLHYTGMITADDIRKIFGNDPETWYEKTPIDSVYLEFAEDFQGWTEDAAQLSLKFIMSSLPRLRKVAHVNAPDSRLLMSSMLSPVSQAELRHFQTGEEKEALKWVRE